MKAYLNAKKEIFRWGPIPGKYYYTADFMESLFSDLINRFPQSVWPKTLILFVDEQMVWLNEFAELREAGRKALTAYMLDKKKRKEIRKQWDDATRKLKEYEQKIKNINLCSLSDDKFRVLVYEFRRRIVDFWLLSIPAECGNYGADIVLDERLSPFVPKDKRPYVMEIITAPEKMSFFQQEEIDLAKNNDLSDHQKKYYWLRNSYVENHVLDISYFKERKKEIDQDVRKKIIQTHNRAKVRKAEVQRAYNLPNEVMHVADIVSDGIAWQDERKKYVFMLQYYKELILHEYARRTKRVVEEVRRMGLHEFFSEKNFSRQKAYGFYFTIGETKEFSDKETRMLWEQFAYPKVSASVVQCKGIIAQPGYIQGKVRVIFDPRKSQDFEEGEVLVAPMTSPDYIFLMKKASAIVTNSGGLTSHAAIISRELQIPCVVGTKFATQLLKDGDMIEVDATKGIIKKLNSR